MTLDPEWHAKWQRDKRAILREIRNEVGWPESEELGPDTVWPGLERDPHKTIEELMWEYITALENAVTAAHRNIARI